MFDLIEKLQERKKVVVCGEKHEVRTKTYYVTEGEKNNWYAKIVFEDHSILVIAPFDDYMYFGKINNVFGDGNNFSDVITYNGERFNKVAEDYQIVKQLVFGDPLLAEGEVSYADYSSEEDESAIISLAVVSRTKQRADVVARVVKLSDIFLGE